MAAEKDHSLIVQFRSQYQLLKGYIDDDPDALRELAESDSSIKDLALELHDTFSKLRLEERRYSELYNAPTDPKFREEWRDFEQRFEGPVSDVFFFDLFGVFPNDMWRESSPKVDPWEIANDLAEERAAGLDFAVNFAAEQAADENKHFTDEVVERVEAGETAWNELSLYAEMDTVGVLRRRLLVPFVLVPRQIFNGIGANQEMSLFTHLKQAHDAFVFGAPFAALALMRSLLEITLKNHYIPKAIAKDKSLDLKDFIEKARSLPPAISRGKLHSLRHLANDIVHFETDKVRMPDDLEREILRLFDVLRTLIEEAPGTRPQY